MGGVEADLLNEGFRERRDYIDSVLLERLLKCFVHVIAYCCRFKCHYLTHVRESLTRYSKHAPFFSIATNLMSSALCRTRYWSSVRSVRM
jgi:hypothetical protein